MAKMNSRGDALLVMTKRPLERESWELHVALFLSEVEGEAKSAAKNTSQRKSQNESPSEAISFLLLLDLVHFAAPRGMAAWLDTDALPAVPLQSNPRIAWLAYASPASASQTFLKLQLDDVWERRPIGALSPREFGRVVRANASLSVGQFVENGFDWGANLGILFDKPYGDMFSPIIQNGDNGPRTTLFWGNWVEEGLVALEVKSPNSDLEWVHSIHRCTNFANSGSMSFRSWLSQRRAYLGLEPDIRAFLKNKPHIRQLRTCFEAMDLEVPRDGIIAENASVTFWREFYELYEVSNVHDQFWSLFLKSKNLDYFAPIETLLQLEQYFEAIRNSSVIFAFPSIEIVTCSWNSKKQEFIHSPAIADYYVNRADPNSGFKRTLLPHIQFNESSFVFRYGSIGAIVSLDLKQLQIRLKQYSKSSRPVFSLVQNSEFSRRLADTYRDSLVFTNLQLTRLFGNVKRSVPAHMPHLINKWVMREIESKLSKYVNSTIRHKFRESDDLQYAFLYFHFLGGLMDQTETGHLDRIWREKLDRDADGILNSNEFETLAAIVLGDSAGKDEKLQLLKCLGENIDSPREQLVTKPPYGSLFLHTSFLSNITLESIRNCSLAATGLAAQFPFQGHMETSSDSDVAFQMIQDDVQDLLDQVETWKRGNG